MRSHRITVTVLTALATSSALRAQVVTSLRGIIGDTFVIPSCLTPDGAVVGGTSQTDVIGAPVHPLTWVHAGPPQTLLGPALTYGALFGVSADGASFVGTANGHAARWGPGGSFAFLTEPAQSTSQANAMSANGSVIVGTITNNSGSFAARWIGSTLQTSGPNARADVVSPDGGIVGGVALSPGAPRLFRWAGATVEYVQQLPASYSSLLRAMSADGSTMLYAQSLTPNLFSSHMWTASGTTDLGFLPGTNHTMAYAMTADTDIAVGYGKQGPAGASRGIIWTRSGGVQEFGEWLGARGMRTGWVFHNVTGVTPDGRTFIGYGLDPSTGAASGFIVTVPGPAVSLVLGMGLIVATPRRRTTGLPTAPASVPPRTAATAD